MLTSTHIPRPRVLQQRRIVAEAPCPGRPRNRGYRCSQTGLKISEKREMSGNCLFGIEKCRTSATFSGVCSPGPDLSKSERSLTDPVNGMRTMLFSFVSPSGKRGNHTSRRPTADRLHPIQYTVASKHTTGIVSVTSIYSLLARPIARPKV